MRAPKRVWALAGALAIVPLAVTAARADYYSWVDSEGVLHLTNVSRRAERATARDREGFGGEPPIVLKVQGEERTLHAVNVSRFDGLIRRAAGHYRLPFAFIKAVMKVESNFNPRARSKADAKGLMQIMDGTARMLNVKDPYDPEQSVFGGARYLRMLANRFEGDLVLTAAAYNAGPRRVAKAGGIPAIRETRRYVARVQKMYRYYRDGK